MGNSSISKHEFKRRKLEIANHSIVHIHSRLKNVLLIARISLFVNMCLGLYIAGQYYGWLEGIPVFNK